MAAEVIEVTLLQIIGAVGFGALIGWYLYYINRYRKAEVQLTDLVTLVGVLGGATVLNLFPGKTDLFGGYGIGLAIGFFGYFLVLLIWVARSDNFDTDWFLDGRRKKVPPSHEIPEGTGLTVTAMGGHQDKEKDNRPDTGGFNG